MLYINARFLTQPITGVQRYALEISKALQQLGVTATWLTPANILHTEIAEQLQTQVIGKRQGHLWEQLDLPAYLKQQGNPLLLNLANTAPLFYRNKISTVHDVAFRRYPQSFSWKFRSAYRLAIPQIIRTSRHLLTVSAFSKTELNHFYGLREDDISVVYNAVADQFTLPNTPVSAEEPYLLAVSSLHYQKNFHGLIAAFNQLTDQSTWLYLIGDLNPNFADAQLLEQIKSNPRIRFLGRVTDQELVDYYRAAIGFVYPSFYEGFGIPPLEAQACGCPCVVSDAASLPEVCQDSALYCQPDKVADMTAKIEMLLTDERLRLDLIAKGQHNIQRFSWQASAQQILTLIEGLK